MAELAMPVGALTSLFLAGGLVVVRDERSRRVVVLALLVTVAASTALGGHWAGLVTALVATASFNFFHLVPYGLLKLNPGDMVFVLVFLLPALPAPGAKRRKLSRAGSNRSDTGTERIRR